MLTNKYGESTSIYPKVVFLSGECLFMVINTRYRWGSPMLKEIGIYTLFKEEHFQPTVEARQDISLCVVGYSSHTLLQSLEICP